MIEAEGPGPDMVIFKYPNGDAKWAVDARSSEEGSGVGVSVRGVLLEIVTRTLGPVEIAWKLNQVSRKGPRKQPSTLKVQGRNKIVKETEQRERGRE